MDKGIYYTTIVIKTLVDIDKKEVMEAKAWEQANEIAKVIPDIKSITVEDGLCTTIVEPFK